MKNDLPWIDSVPPNYNSFVNENGHPYFVHQLATLTELTKIGNYTYIHGKTRFNGNQEIRIGNFCSIANDVRIQVGDEHNYKKISTFPFKTVVGLEGLDYEEVRGDGVLIGNDVWIGEGVRILSGAVIGDGVVIGAGTVVRGVLEPYGVYTGNPMQLRRIRCSKNTVKKLQDIKWWNWDLQKVKNNAAFFSLSLSDLESLDNQILAGIIR